MLRFLMTLSLCLLIVFTGIGLLLSRQWGWSEYASDKLYVVYYQLQQNRSDPAPYFLVDNSGTQWPLAASSGAITAAACSPDGRTLAFLTDDGELHTINQAGVIYDRKLGHGYDAVTVANNGKAAVNQKVYGITLVVDSSGISVPIPPNQVAYDPIIISSSGNALWSHIALGGIDLVSPSGEVLMTVGQGESSPTWMADEQMFTFSSMDRRTSALTGGIADTVRQEVTPLYHSMIPYGVLSPDSTLEVLRFLPARQSHEQLYLVDALTGQSKQQLTNDSAFHIPVCFLTFQPQTLISP